jgi:hypothetical protein
VLQHHDLVHLIQAFQVVGDQQRTPPGRGGQQRPGQREPLPLAAGQRGAVRADRGVPAERQRADPVEQPGPVRGRGELCVAASSRARRRLSRMVASKMCGSAAQPVITARTSSGS